MSMLNFYLYRASPKLPAEHRSVLVRERVALRRLYGR
jgi:hypothetical protein